MAVTNRAAWLMHKQQKPFQIEDAPMPSPGEQEVVIRARAVALNPCDPGIQGLGLVWTKFPCIIGCDLAGDVVAVGSRVTNFKQGDRVLACLEQGAFQLFPVADTTLVAKLPDSISYVDGCVVPTGLSTSAVSLFHPDNLALPPPQLDVKPKGKVVVAWGAASSVGSGGVQLLRAAGYEVAAVAGSYNAQYAKDLGAEYVFDYRSEDVVEQIVTALQGKDFAGVFTAIMTDDVVEKCARIADKLGKDEKSRVVATVLPSTMPFTGPVPDGVRITYCFFTAELLPNSQLADENGRKPNTIAQDVWGAWLTPALESGAVRCKPDAEIVGQGLESLQSAVDRMGEGVSAKKLVVEIP